LPKKKSNTPLISIIIPLPGFNDYIRESIEHYEKLAASGNFEIIILPDFEEKEILSNTLPILVIPSGKVGPAEKRDLGAKHASGSILAFIDDDAYPRADWLANAAALFKDTNVAAVGGPAITPPGEPFWKKLSGDVFESFLTSFNERKRYIPVGSVQEEYDLPSVNLLVRKDIFEKAGGFDSTFYPGEDTKLCLEIKKLGFRILYSPDILVYHHRRDLFPNHFRQVANYARHRGYFAKTYPETSFKLKYFVPSFFLIFTVAGFLTAPFSTLAALVYWLVMAVYFLIDVIFALKPGILETFWTLAGVFLTHLVYGFNFLRGFIFTTGLKR
jgi:GT2 family glycosyltransferase